MGLNARGELLVLVEWVRDVWASGSIVDTVDPRLEDYVADEADCCARTPCLRRGPACASSCSTSTETRLCRSSRQVILASRTSLRFLKRLPRWRLRSQVCQEEDDPSGSIN